MTKTLLGIALLTLISLPTPSFAATTGQYVCQQTAIDPNDIAATLNGLGCDVSKPFTVNYASGASLAIVCCVSS